MVRGGRSWLLFAVAVAAIALGALYAVNRLFPRVLHGGSIEMTGRIATSDRSRAAAARVTPALTTSLAEKGLSLGAGVFIRIFKAQAQLEVWVLDRASGKYVIFRTYAVQRFSGDLGPKLKEGDRQAPEGFYAVRPEALNPLSRFNLSFDVGYPNAYDRALGRTGKEIMVHGGSASVGCFAMGDEAIEEIYTLVESALGNGADSVPLHIYPFRMDSSTMAAHADAKWADFWRNLKEGYDFFETNQVPPTVDVRDGRYLFTGEVR
jgi:murein L,D-transpeptidase YafK